MLKMNDYNCLIDTNFRILNKYYDEINNHLFLLALFFIY